VINRLVNLGLTRENREGGGGRQKIKKLENISFEVSCSQRRCPKKLTCVAAPSPRASLGRRTVCGRTEQLSAAGFEALRK